MTPRGLISPTHRAIRKYYKDLRALQDQHVLHEMGLRSPFQRLLEDTAKLKKWTLVAELSEKTSGGRVQPDGTLRDWNSLPRGYWEAKDTHDDLDREVKKKTARGYKLSNTIFEDTQTGILYQNRQEVLRVPLGDPQELAKLLNQFFSYTEPDIESFEEAIEEFKERVPELAKGLVEKIQQAHKDNPPFIAAFDKFFALCKSALNPNIRAEAVDEMLVQHLLTERLFRTIFNNPEFIRRNAIAAEVEEVITALVSKSFDRTDFLRSLDRFYVAIESAARTLPDFSEKQHFLNTMYERFFQGYSVKMADTHGVVYTPQEIVNFMCASVAEVLESEFGKSLSSKDVCIIDPCTGTGNFMVNLLRRVPKRYLPRMYKDQLFANEVMLLPYYIAALNIEHAYYELTGEYEPFDGLCFVDTLDLTEDRQSHLYVTEKNAERVERQRRTPITVVIGNPPYNMNQQNENDNNKNRKYMVIDGRVRDTYAISSKATLKTKLYDPYVKFFRWATDRLEGRDGIVCFVSNNSFLDRRAFDGMQKHLLRDFTDIYHVDLHGNVRKNPKLSGTTHNVFGIQVGVGITVAVRRSANEKHQLHYHRVPENWRREEKIAFLGRVAKASNVDWRRLSAGQWLHSGRKEYEKFLSIGTRQGRASSTQGETIFKAYSPGISTARDDVAYAFEESTLRNQVQEFCENYDAEVDRYKRNPKKPKGRDLDEFLDTFKVKWSETLKKSLVRGRYLEFDPSNIRTSLYRPFTRRFLYLADLVIDRPGHAQAFFPSDKTTDENRVVVTSDIAYRSATFSVLAVNRAADLHLCASADGHQCFPFYVYDEDGSNRRENITDWALEYFRKHYPGATKWDIFYYVYGLLHHPEYREKYAENLKRELPRIPMAEDFRGFAEAGRKLARLHVEYEAVEPWELGYIEARGKRLSYRAEDKMRLAKDRKSLKVNDSLTLAGIPAEAFEYRLGNRSALEWVIDQYRVTENKRSGIRSDPNRAADQEYIVRLVGQVIRVSMETVRIVKALPGLEGIGNRLSLRDGLRQ